MFKLEKVKVKHSKENLRNFLHGGFWCFVLNDSGTTKTVLKPTDDSLQYFHLINIKNEEVVTPICGTISRFELSHQFDFKKPNRFFR